MELPELAKRLLDNNVYVVLSTSNADGTPQSSVIWAKRDGDEIVFSTIRGRRKTRNMQSRPVVSVCAHDPANPYCYFEVRGPVSLTEEAGPALIEELSQRYDGKAFTEGHPDNIRVVCRLRPAKVYAQ